ncbi:nucleotide exchange factor GrpE [Candidatus Bathycorpusculum sp.]|uniref:nucleotide exchange factor GrpE n=1 Tax=Candidatus Bathycorpusculum sp. TaxID=2994959 RepID=UPI00282C6777|nr:nucleotide exchange factor GrpE [Candidatus Termitimicrobium sp.]MCL2431515.1 nucleotide exchange factor GrpE [Candidatus Termitimicrobium sp.]
MVENKEKNKPQEATDSEKDFKKLLDIEKQKTEEYLNKLQYLQADFENQKKRFDRETENIKKYCNERIITELLDIVDELDLALKAVKDSKDPQKQLVDGVEMTLKKLRKILEQEGVSQISCTQGTIFDPACHNAIAAEEREDVQACIIIEEIRRGYKIKDKVLRPSIVRVTKPK